MPKLRVAVLGIGSIGIFHVREFVRAGAEVVAIATSKKETAEAAVKRLQSEFGISPKPYFDLNTLLANEKLDAVSICTPPNLHYIQVKKCLEAGLHVLCEKPFVLNSDTQNYVAVQELVELSEKKGVMLSVNTQWPSILERIQERVDLTTLKSFSMYSQPAVAGIGMLTDHLSHANSVLVKLMPGGKARAIQFIQKSEKDIEVRFVYANNVSECDTRYHFVHKADRPREVRFSFNGMEFRRVIGEQYQQKFVADKTEFLIEDPLRVSIGKFIAAVNGDGVPLVSKKEILENAELQDVIIAEYLKQHKLT